MLLHKNQIIPLTIHDISNDGNGVGRYEGKAVFVPAAALGDKLNVTIVKDLKSHAYGRIQQIVQAGPGRIKEDCPISAPCGGCSFRHIEYKAELDAKQGFVQNALHRIGKIEHPVLPIIGSPLQDRYRNKAQYPVTMVDGNLTYGFYASRSHRIIPCKDCLLQPEQMNQLAALAIQLLQNAGVKAYDEKLHTGFLRHIYIRESPSTKQLMLCLVATSVNLPKKEDFINAIVAAFPAVKTIVLNINPDKTNVICGSQTIPLFGDGTIQGVLSGVPVLLDALSFCQVNTLGAEQLFNVVHEYAAPTSQDILLDLYCGAGVIGLSMAQKCKQLIGVEIIPQAIENARKSARQMGLANTKFIAKDAGKAAQQLQEEGLSPDIITVDPPRKGCDEATLQAIIQMQPQRIVMVSCNPATLARDLATLTSCGYTLQKVQPVDMFPRTTHTEVVALLKKTRNSTSRIIH